MSGRTLRGVTTAPNGTTHFVASILLLGQTFLRGRARGISPRRAGVRMKDLSRATAGGGIGSRARARAFAGIEVGRPRARC